MTMLASGGYVLTKNCAGIFEPDHSINSIWQFLSCAIIAFGERYVLNCLAAVQNEYWLVHPRSIARCMLHTGDRPNASKELFLLDETAVVRIL
jgi:hypothetical protein